MNSSRYLCPGTSPRAPTFQRTSAPYPWLVGKRQVWPVAQVVLVAHVVLLNMVHLLEEQVSPVEQFASVVHLVVVTVAHRPTPSPPSTFQPLVDGSESGVTVIAPVELTDRTAPFQVPKTSSGGMPLLPQVPVPQSPFDAHAKPGAAPPRHT